MTDAQGSTIRAAKSAVIYRGVEELPPEFGPSVAAIGNFDGVHLGHREILAGAVNEARELGTRAVAVTFDPHPEQVLRPTSAPRLITPTTERLRLLAATGVDAVLVLRFDQELARLEAGEFVRTVLAGALKVRSVHEGRSFRFGHGARAGVAELTDFGADFGFAVRVHEAVRVRGLEVSSSAIRMLVAGGDVRRPGPRDRHPAAGANGESGALRRAASGIRRVRDAAQSERAQVSRSDKRGQSADVWRALLCSRIAHSGF
jgi:hypothetical protein